MALLSLQDVSLDLGGKPLLDKVSLSVEEGERICLVGRNGAGKSSLLGVIGETIQPDSGLVVRNSAPFGQMPQEVPASWQGSVFEIVADALEGEAAGLKNLHLLSENSSANSLNSKDISQIEGDWSLYAEALSIIHNLGLKPNAIFSTLSGGTKRRVALARALLCSGNLLLDEPTNHLDIKTIAWLEDFLMFKAKTIIFVSHDRAFASKLSSRIIELDRGNIYSYDCTYDRFAEKREERLEIEEKHFALFDKKLAQEETWIRQGVKARRTRNMGRVRALIDMRNQRSQRREKLGVSKIQAQEADKSGRLVLDAKDISFTYPDGYKVFNNFSTIIQRGDKIGIIGDNGTGKTTLIRVLLGELEPSTGEIRQGTKLEPIFFDQMRDSLDPEKSVMDSVADGNDRIMFNGNNRHVAGYLQDFLFTPDRLRLPVKALSGGERSRLLLARLFIKPSNLLVLDEPTNDLDIETLELLEELIADYSGTVLMVSHDRNFLDNLVTSIFALEGEGKIHEYVGGYTDWLRQTQGTKKTDEKETKEVSDKTVAETTPPAKPRKRTYAEQRELDALKKELEGLPLYFEKLELEQKDIEEQLADPQVFSENRVLFDTISLRLPEIEQELMEQLARLDELEELIANLEGSEV